MCGVCKGKRYLICERDDGREAVERCDACSSYGPRRLQDECAARLATRDGIACARDYPCYLLDSGKGANPLI